ncbi:GGDEF domain-containing protein [Arthrobacter sp. D3-16]
MVLDTATLRIAFGVMALALVFLFYFCTYRPARSPYSGWWCVALLFFLTGSLCFLMNRTDHQIWANPLGNTLLVTGALAVWAGARSLRLARPAKSVFVGIPLLTLVVSALDNSAVNTWSGGPFFLAFMSLAFGLTAHELWRLDRDYSGLRIPMAVSSAGLAVFYAFRLFFFLLEGQAGPVFVTVFGPAATTMVTMVLLVVVSYSMAALSTEQQTRALRIAATRDGLTGLLNRKAFLDLADRQLNAQAEARTSGALILADLDHFKAINDTFGHAAGDEVLRAFADACTATVRSTDLVGRYGGEEFVLLLPGAHGQAAQAVTEEISRRLAAAMKALPVPTSSYGISTYGEQTVTLDDLIRAADEALYRAKAQGRNRSETSDRLERRDPLPRNITSGSNEPARAS